MDKEFSEKVTNYFKNDYIERGIIKWRGYFLSDHTSALKDWKNVEIELDSVTTELKLDRNIGGGVQAIKNE